MLAQFSQYPSFIAFSAAGIAVVVTMLIMPLWKKFLRASHIGQQVRADGPESHLVKQGTPTMGGVAMMLGMLLTVIICGIWNHEVNAILIATSAAALLGLVDDAAKVIFHRSLGLGPIAKLVIQFLTAILFIIYAVNYLNISPTIKIPFLVDINLGIWTTTIPIFDGVDIPWLYLIICSILIVGMSNAVNLTDGLDGLAAGICMIVMLIMGMIAYRINNLGAAVISAAFAGTCIAFLWHNSYPADIFMGDTGSLSLGMAFGCLSILTKTEFLSIIIGGMFVVEALSVMIQVAHYKRTKKRLFLMAPLHHHFEKKGWSETKVVVRFWLLAGLCAGVGFVIYFAQSVG